SFTFAEELELRRLLQGVWNLRTPDSYPTTWTFDEEFVEVTSGDPFAPQKTKYRYRIDARDTPAELTLFNEAELLPCLVAVDHDSLTIELPDDAGRRPLAFSPAERAEAFAANQHRFTRDTGSASIWELRAIAALSIADPAPLAALAAEFRALPAETRRALP